MGKCCSCDDICQSDDLVLYYGDYFCKDCFLKYIEMAVPEVVTEMEARRDIYARWLVFSISMN